MADAQKTIDLIFNGIDKTGAATLSALNNAKSFTSSLQNATQPIADFTVGALKVEAGLLAAGLAMTVFAVKVAGDFDTAFRQLGTLFDASDADMAAFKVNIQSYASTSSKSIEDIMGSLQAAIGSGVKYTEALDLMTVAEKLAIATKADMKGTTEVLVSTMNAYGMSTKDAGSLADLMFQIIKDGKIEMDDLARSLSMVTPLAAAAGVSMKEVGAAVAVLTASGIAPATAIEYLRSAISNIIKPSAEATKLAGELGIQFDANALKSKGLAVVLDDVARATGGNSGQMSKLIGDVGGLVAAMVLTGPQADKFKETITSMGNSAGSVAGAYEKMAGSMENAKQRVVNAFTGMMTVIGTPLLDEFGGIANAIAAIFTALGAGVKEGGLKDLATYIESVFGDIKTSIETVAKNLPAALAGADFSGFKGGIDAVIQALKSMFGSIDLTSVSGLKDLIELAGTAFLGLSKYVAGVIESFKPLFDALLDVGKGAKGVDLSFLELAGNLGGIATQLNAVLPLFTGLLAILTVNQTFSLVSSLMAVAPALGAAGAAMGVMVAGPASVAALGAAFALAGYNLGTGLNPHIDAFVSKMAGTKTTLGGWIYDLVNGAEEAKRLGLNSAGAAAGVGKLGEAVNKAGNAGEAAKGFGQLDAELVKAAESSRLAQESFRKSEITVQNSTAAVNKLANAQKEGNTYALKTVPIFDALTGAITGYEQQLVKSEKGTIKLTTASASAGTNLTKIADETKKAEDAQKKWNEEVAKMKFQEKLALIEQQTKLMTAQIEADAKKTVAAFESIGVSITSTGDVLGDLFGLMKDFDNLDWSTQNKIDKQIDKENERRDEALKLQKELTEAQIAQMRAQTNALIKGDGLIKIDGAGLKPHLEAFMWEILQAIQVKVNKDGLKLLLGA